MDFEELKNYIGRRIIAEEVDGEYRIRAIKGNKILYTGEKVKSHIGHRIVVVPYGRDHVCVDVSIECERCNEVIYDVENPDL
jgi:hypothetical protein